MNRRLLIAGVVGAVAMFLWIFVAHMALPLGEAGIKQIDNEEPLLTAMKSTLHGSGMYMFPRMDTNDQAANQRRIAAGPSGLLIYHSARDFQFGKLLAVEFAVELVLVLVGMYLLSLTRIRTFAGRLGFFALLGLGTAAATNVSYWNWYGFPGAYTLAYSFTGWVGYLCAGLVAGVMKVGGAKVP